MTTELEKHFFNIFEIEPIGCNDNENCTGTLDCRQCTNAKYPQITDRILLELLAVCNSKTYEEYKVQALNIIIAIMSGNPYHIHQVQALFEENNNDR